MLCIIEKKEELPVSNNCEVKRKQTKDKHLLPRFTRLCVLHMFIDSVLCYCSLSTVLLNFVFLFSLKCCLFYSIPSNILISLPHKLWFIHFSPPSFPCPFSWASIVTYEWSFPFSFHIFLCCILSSMKTKTKTVSNWLCCIPNIYHD